MRRMPNQNQMKQISRLRVTDDILYKSISKNATYKIALQLYYINKLEGKQKPRLPQNDFRRVVVKPKKEISMFRRLGTQLRFDFAHVFVQKIIPIKSTA
jgi:hypothetical protein